MSTFKLLKHNKPRRRRAGPNAPPETPEEERKRLEKNLRANNQRTMNTLHRLRMFGTYVGEALNRTRFRHNKLQAKKTYVMGAHIDELRKFFCLESLFC